MLVNITSSSEFHVHINGAAGKLVVVNFTASWCGACHAIFPRVQELSRTYASSVVFLKVDADQCKELAQSHAVQALPTFVFYRSQVRLETITGADVARLEAKIRELGGDMVESETIVDGHIDLQPFLSLEFSECLNEADSHGYRGCLKDSEEYLLSDCDEQLMLAIAFIRSVKLHSLRITCKVAEQAPKTIKLFINQPNTLSFDSALQMEPVQKLTYLSTGSQMQTVAWSFRVGNSTMSGIVRETCQAISDALWNTVVRCPQSPNEWLQIEVGFNNRWQLPHCIGAIDGKHIIIQAPKNAGSSYFNYKKDHSIDLLAVADASYRFRYANIGAYGGRSDAGTFRDTPLCRRLNDKTLGVPVPSKLDANSDIQMPYFLIGDEAFPLKEFLMRPFSGRSTGRMPFQEEIFNYRLSPDQAKGSQLVPLKFVKFQDVRSILVFIVDNQSGDEVTRLDRICFYGSPNEITNMNDFRRGWPWFQAVGIPIGEIDLLVRPQLPPRLRCVPGASALDFPAVTDLTASPHQPIQQGPSPNHLQSTSQQPFEQGFSEQNFDSCSLPPTFDQCSLEDVSDSAQEGLSPNSSQSTLVPNSPQSTLSPSSPKSSAFPGSSSQSFPEEASDPYSPPITFGSCSSQQGSFSNSSQPTFISSSPQTVGPEQTFGAGYPQEMSDQATSEQSPDCSSVPEQFDHRISEQAFGSCSSQKPSSSSEQGDSFHSQQGFNSISPQPEVGTRFPPQRLSLPVQRPLYVNTDLNAPQGYYQVPQEQNRFVGAPYYFGRMILLRPRAVFAGPRNPVSRFPVPFIGPFGPLHAQRNTIRHPGSVFPRFIPPYGQHFEFSRMENPSFPIGAPHEHYPIENDPARGFVPEQRLPYQTNDVPRQSVQEFNYHGTDTQNSPRGRRSSFVRSRNENERVDVSTPLLPPERDVRPPHERDVLPRPERDVFHPPERDVFPPLAPPSLRRNSAVSHPRGHGNPKKSQ